MYKEIVITIIIIILVVVGDLLTHNYTETTAREMDSNLNNLKENILNNYENEKAISEILDIENKWKSMQGKLAYYLEHNEIERVNTELTEIRGYIEIDESKESIPKIENCKNLLNHIKDKQTFNFKNIF